MVRGRRQAPRWSWVRLPAPLDPGPPARGRGGLKIPPWAVFSAFPAPGPEARGPAPPGKMIVLIILAS